MTFFWSFSAEWRCIGKTRRHAPSAAEGRQFAPKKTRDKCVSLPPRPLLWPKITQPTLLGKDATILQLFVSPALCLFWLVPCWGFVQTSWSCKGPNSPSIRSLSQKCFGRTKTLWIALQTILFSALILAVQSYDGRRAQPRRTNACGKSAGRQDG